jgi:hypothetical protein
MRHLIRELLLSIFQGWQVREEMSPEAREQESMEQTYARLSGGDELVGATLPLLTHWDNDLMSIAPHYGIAYEFDPATGSGYIREDVPPAPSPNHWWHRGAWQAPTLPEDAAAPTAPANPAE